MKWCLTFAECKPMVLNSTNGQVIAAFLGSENTDDWVGHKIVLFNDPSVMYAGKFSGGLRARAPKNQGAPRATPAPTRPQPARAPLAEDGENFESAKPVKPNRVPEGGQAFAPTPVEDEPPF
jgi:hypothetical protein